MMDEMMLENYVAKIEAQMQTPAVDVLIEIEKAYAMGRPRAFADPAQGKRLKMNAILAMDTVVLESMLQDPTVLYAYCARRQKEVLPVYKAHPASTEPVPSQYERGPVCEVYAPSGYFGALLIGYVTANMDQEQRAQFIDEYLVDGLRRQSAFDMRMDRVELIVDQKEPRLLKANPALLNYPAQYLATCDRAWELYVQHQKLIAMCREYDAEPKNKQVTQEIWNHRESARYRAGEIGSQVFHGTKNAWDGMFPGYKKDGVRTDLPLEHAIEEENSVTSDHLELLSRFFLHLVDGAYEQVWKYHDVEFKDGKLFASEKESGPYKK